MVTNRNRSSSRHGSKGVPVNTNTCEQNGQKQIIWCKLDFNFMTVWFHTNSSCPWNYPWFVSLGFFPRFLFMFFSLRHLPQRPWSAPVRRRHQSPEHRPRQPVTTVGITPGIVGATCGKHVVLSIICEHEWTWYIVEHVVKPCVFLTRDSQKKKNMFLQLVVFYWGFSSKSFGKVQRWGPREVNSQHWVISLMMI